MRLELAPPSALPEYARIGCAFVVREVVVLPERLPATTFATRPVRPWTKDYDADPDERPDAWPRRFDLSRWAVLLARHGAVAAGGAVVAFDTPGVDMLEGRRDLAVLWDLRVAAGARGTGVGAALFRAAEAWAREQGCALLKVETQDVNAPACRFYARMGCELRTARRGAYPTLPEEVQLLWYRDLVHARPDAGTTRT